MARNKKIPVGDYCNQKTELNSRDKFFLEKKFKGKFETIPAWDTLVKKEGLLNNRRIANNKNL